MTRIWLWLLWTRVHVRVRMHMCVQVRVRVYLNLPTRAFIFLDTNQSLWQARFVPIGLTSNLLADGRVLGALGVVDLTRAVKDLVSLQTTLLSL